MAAYAALASLMNTIQDIIKHSQVSTFFENNHTQILLEMTSSLLDFIEANNYGEKAEDLEREIKFAAEAAEKMIDLHIMDQIYAETNLRQSLDLQQHIHDMEVVMKKANEFKGKQRSGEEQGARVLVPYTEIEETSMVGLDAELESLLHELTRDPKSSRKTISIIGMGGMDNSHFPVLEKLLLRDMICLEEIPLGIGDIPTLELIRLEDCKNSAAISALKIKENQLDNGNDSLQIHVRVRSYNQEEFKARAESEGLSIRNIQFET